MTLCTRLPRLPRATPQAAVATEQRSAHYAAPCPLALLGAKSRLALYHREHVAALARTLESAFSIATAIGSPCAEDGIVEGCFLGAHSQLRVSMSLASTCTCVK